MSQLLTTSPTAYVLDALTQCLCDLVLMRAEENSLQHVVVQLPAQVFEKVRLDIRAENSKAVLGAFEFSEDANSFRFNGIRYERKS